MTLLEIMIVLAILALVMGLLIGPKIIDGYRKSQRKIAKLAVDRIADQDYPVWVAEHPAQHCPAGVAELEPRATTDPWGSEYKLHCGPTAPETAAFGAASFGEDQREGTPDDIVSWR